MSLFSGLTYFGFQPGGNSDPLTFIEMDAVFSERINFKSKIPDIPVESGYNVHDHIIRLPPEVEMTAGFTDTPIYNVNPLNGVLQSAEGRSAKKAKELIDLRDKGELFSVLLSLDWFDNYFFSELETNKTPADGKSIRIRAVLKHLIVVKNSQEALASNMSNDVMSVASPMRSLGTVHPSLAAGVGWSPF